jgi:hypothetical protein
VYFELRYVKFGNDLVYYYMQILLYAQQRETFLRDGMKISRAKRPIQLGNRTRNALILS